MTGRLVITFFGFCVFGAASAYAADSCDAVGIQKVFDSASPMTYLCCAQSFSDSSIRRGTQVSISSVSKANPAVITSTAHGFPISARPQVTIAGATGTGWTGINGSFTATVIDADTFSIPVDSSAFGTLGGTVYFTTTAPRLSIAEWAVQKFVYSGTTLIWSGWLGGAASFNQKCSLASSSSTNQQ